MPPKRNSGRKRRNESTERVEVAEKKQRGMMKNIDDGQTDSYCWICHKRTQDKICVTCPRVYHNDCLAKSSGEFSELNACPECQVEAVDGTKFSNKLPVDMLKKLLTAATIRIFLKKRDKNEMFLSWPEDLRSNKLVRIIDSEILRDRINRPPHYTKPAEFFSDVKFMSHNCCILFGDKSSESKAAEQLKRDFRRELLDLEACPECYFHLYSEESTAHDPFVRLCNPPHSIVWAKLTGHPYWPAKCLKVINGNAHVKFFGEHEKSDIPLNKCIFLSEKHPKSSSAPKSSRYQAAKKELDCYIRLYVLAYGKFPFKPINTPFQPDFVKNKKNNDDNAIENESDEDHTDAETLESGRNPRQFKLEKVFSYANEDEVIDIVNSSLHEIHLPSSGNNEGSSNLQKSSQSVSPEKGTIAKQVYQNISSQNTSPASFQDHSLSDLNPLTSESFRNSVNSNISPSVNSLKIVSSFNHEALPNTISSFNHENVPRTVSSFNHETVPGSVSSFNHETVPRTVSSFSHQNVPSTSADLGQNSSVVDSNVLVYDHVHEASPPPNIDILHVQSLRRSPTQNTRRVNAPNDDDIDIIEEGRSVLEQQKQYFDPSVVLKHLQENHPQMNSVIQAAEYVLKCIFVRMYAAANRTPNAPETIGNALSRARKLEVENRKLRTANATINLEKTVKENENKDLKQAVLDLKEKLKAKETDYSALNVINEETQKNAKMVINTLTVTVQRKLDILWSAKLKACMMENDEKLLEKETLLKEANEQLEKLQKEFDNLKDTEEYLRKELEELRKELDVEKQNSEASKKTLDKETASGSDSAYQDQVLIWKKHDYCCVCWNPAGIHCCANTNYCSTACQNSDTEHSRCCTQKKRKVPSSSQQQKFSVEKSVSISLEYQEQSSTSAERKHYSRPSTSVRNHAFGHNKRQYSSRAKSDPSV